MLPSPDARLAALVRQASAGVLRGGLRGIEKESLRVTPDGEIVRTWTGLLTEDKLAELVEELIDISAGS